VLADFNQKGKYTSIVFKRTSTKIEENPFRSLLFYFEKSDRGRKGERERRIWRN